MKPSDGDEYATKPVVVLAEPGDTSPRTAQFLSLSLSSRTVSRELVEELWTALSTLVGPELRVVTWYEGRAFETKMRDDVRQQYSTLDDQAVIDDIVGWQLRFPGSIDRHNSGELDASVRVFEDAWVVIWPLSYADRSGIVVSVERGGAVSMDIVDDCIDYLTTNLRPRLG